VGLRGGNRVPQPPERLGAERSADGEEPVTAARSTADAADRRSIVNALSIDVEDWFQVEAMSGVIGRGEWDRIPPRVEWNTDRILAMLEERDIRATFFCLGWVARRFPALVSRIAAAGHEIASHGTAHQQVFRLGAEEFRRDVRDSRRLLEDIAGRPVQGYRAPSFSIRADTPWAFEILAEEGYRYSSSVYPIRHDLYGMPQAPRRPYRPAGGNGLVELPMTTVGVLGRNLPCSGGGYFRLLPYAVSRAAMRRVAARERRPLIFYFHPWEIDRDQPRRDGLSWKSRFRHYVNLSRMEAKLARLLGDFRWGRIDEAFGPVLADEVSNR
jgi:polysaccharide deacetylase family protein (PEP-CTERM system associated)